MVTAGLKPTASELFEERQEAKTRHDPKMTSTANKSALDCFPFFYACRESASETEDFTCPPDTRFGLRLPRLQDSGREFHSSTQLMGNIYPMMPLKATVHACNLTSREGPAPKATSPFSIHRNTHLPRCPTLKKSPRPPSQHQLE
jgi:hypothetical protein